MRGHVAIVASLVGMSVVPSARADDAADTATARALGIEGVTLADAGRCRDAVEKLQRAEKLHHAPSTATRLAECEIELGHLVSGTERLQRVVREPLAPGAHPAFVAAVARAQKDLDAALPRLATIRIAVIGAPLDPPPTTTIDAEAVPDASLDSPRRIDPGTHVIEVRAPGFRPGAVTASLAPGEAKNVTVELVRDPDFRVADVAAPVPGLVASPHAERSNGLALASFGIGAAGLALGIAGALVVDRLTGALDQRCDARHVCPTDASSDLGQAKTWATVSTTGFVVAGAGAVTGLVLLFLPRSREKRLPPTARLRPAVGPTSIGLDGVF